jgi:translation initiation factor 4E
MCYQHLRRPTAMPYGTTLHIFKKGIKPVWEDPSLAKGSRFQLKSEKKTTSKYWEDLVLAMIGEQLGTKSDIVAGLVLNLKAQFDKVAIWFTDCDD